MKLRLVLMTILGVVFWVPNTTQAQSTDSAKYAASSVSWILSELALPDFSDPSTADAPFTLMKRANHPDREVMSCASGKGCIFFPDRSGELTGTLRREWSSIAALGPFEQDPIRHTALRFDSLETKDIDPELPDTVSKSRSKPMAMSGDSGFAWGPALAQSLLFLGIEHGIRIAFDPPTRHAMTGPFWNDYVSSLSTLKTWGDNNPAYINYLGHPMQGAITGYFQIQNDPKGKALGFSSSREYWTSRLKALAWSAGYSAFFELGFPISEAAVGNLGLKNSSTSPKMGYVDLVITPTLGLAWVIAEDVVDTYLVRDLEGRTQSPTLRAIIRSVLNPMRSAANVLRFKYPWYRD